MCPDGKITLVVTGGIGSGKSLVCSMFGLKGIPVYDSDSRTKALYDSIPGMPDRISQALGVDVCRHDGRIDRKILADAVFSDKRRLEILESLIYPEVRTDFLEWKKAFEDTDVPFVIMESAVILEKPYFHDLSDKVLLVDAPVKLRLSRAMARDKAGADSIEARMSGQKLLNAISEGKVIPDADYIIVNDGDREALTRKVDKIYSEIINSSKI